MTAHQDGQQFLKPSQAVIQWLLDSDPSIRWQVMRDLTGEPHEVIATERSRVATIDGIKQHRT